jgi:hypothetical protein
MKNKKQLLVIAVVVIVSIFLYKRWQTKKRRELAGPVWLTVDHSQTPASDIIPNSAVQ